jgi:hypothetical protein
LYRPSLKISRSNKIHANLYRITTFQFNFFSLFHVLCHHPFISFVLILITSVYLSSLNLIWQVARRRFFFFVTIFIRKEIFFKDSHVKLYKSNFSFKYIKDNSLQNICHIRLDKLKYQRPMLPWHYIIKLVTT